MKANCRIPKFIWTRFKIERVKMLDFFKCENSRDGQGNVEKENCDITRANDCVNIAFVCKGQLISEGNFGVFKSLEGKPF